jgi:peptidoglycan hydrolase-like protein with peptidoglycan-binding domain
MKKLGLLAALIFLLPSAAFAATFNRSLSYGTTGTDVSEFQQFLTDEGLFNGSITATFGTATQAALIAFQKQENIIPASGYFGPTTMADANVILAAHPAWTTPISNSAYYSNVNGNSVHSPVQAPAIPAGATAQCKDGSYSFSLHHSGTCSGHRGVARWL